MLAENIHWNKTNLRKLLKIRCFKLNLGALRKKIGSN